MPTMVYLAGRYGRREELWSYAQTLAEYGYVVTARWLTGAHAGTSTDDGHTPLSPAESARFAQEDMADLRAAELFIAFTESPRSSFSRGGRHVELGLALAWEIPVMVVGPRENVFCGLPEICQCPTWQDALDVLIPAHGEEEKYGTI